MKTRKLTAHINLLSKELKKMEERLCEQQKPLLEKTTQLQEQIDKMEKLWKVPVNYNELVALSKLPLHRQIHKL
jgi:hypothetical protein